MKFAVLASTNGTDMVVLHEHPPLAEFALVITNQECGALEKARRWNIPNVLISSKGKSREEFEAEVHKELVKHDIDFIILIGFMRILSPYLISKWKNKIMNIHPSLLPAFPGIHSIEDALKANVKITGCTLHFVDEGMDTGPIILQGAVDILQNDTHETLKKRIQDKEMELIFKGVNLFAQNKIVVQEKKVFLKS